MAASSYRIGGMSSQQRKAYQDFINLGTAIRSSRNNVAMSGLNVAAGPTGTQQASYMGSGVIGILPYAGVQHPIITSWRMDGSAAGCMAGYRL